MKKTEDVLIKIKRHYKDNEIINALYKTLSEKNIEIGMLKSEIDELNYNITQYQKLSKNELKQCKLNNKQNQQFQELKQNYESKIKQNKDLIKLRDKLLLENQQLKNLNKLT